MGGSIGDAVHSLRLSTVVPGNAREQSAVRELQGGDLALKLHYLRAVYYFHSSEAVAALTAPLLKKPMFHLLDIYYPAAGRIRRDDSGRPHVKCNDGGVRILEATCDSTMDQCLTLNKPDDRLHRLVPQEVLGPDILFSPPLHLQFTKFKCGGLAVGLSWAHFLGDPISASNFINLWGQMLSGIQVPKNSHLYNLQNDAEKPVKSEIDTILPRSVMQVTAVGDLWQNPNTKRMAAFSIRLTENKLNELQSKFPEKISTFETLAAILWQNIARIRAEKEPKLVTVCRNSPTGRSLDLSNQVEVNTVTATSSPSMADLLELAKLINKKAMDEMGTIQQAVNKESGRLDVILYGSNLTFVDMESVNFYGLELKGQKPAHVECSIDGVGDEGAVFVLPSHDIGRVVSFMLPEVEIAQLIELLENDWGI